MKLAAVMTRIEMMMLNEVVLIASKHETWKKIRDNSWPLAIYIDKLTIHNIAGTRHAKMFSTDGNLQVWCRTGVGYVSIHNGQSKSKI